MMRGMVSNQKSNQKMKWMRRKMGSHCKRRKPSILNNTILISGLLKQHRHLNQKMKLMKAQIKKGRCLLQLKRKNNWDLMEQRTKQHNYKN
jgi:hypothetical protein